MVNFQEMWSALDWIIIVLYFAAIIGIGLYMRRRASKNMKSFFVASRRLTIPVLIGVGAASWMDSWTIVGVAECGTTMGICLFFMYIIPNGILRLPLALWVGPIVRDKMPDWVITMPDLMEYLYNKGSRVVMAFGMLAPFLYESALLTAGGQVLSYVSGVNVMVCFAVLGVIAVIYTALSGMWGLAVSDMLQFVIMTLGAGFLAIGMIAQFGSYGEIFTQAGAINPNLTTVWGGNGFMEVLAWAIGAMAMYANSQSYQRFGASKSGGDIKVAYSCIMLFYVIFATVFLVAGMAALVAYPDAAAEAPSEAFWALVFSTLPIGLRGLFVAAVLSAVLSTVSADYLILGAVVVHDILMGTFNVKFTERGEVRAQRIVIAIFGILMILATAVWADGIAKAYYYCGGFQVAAFFIPLLLGLFYKHKTPAAGFWSLLLTIIAYFVWQFILQCPGGVPSNLACLIFSAVVFIVVSEATYGSYSKKLAGGDKEEIE